MNREGQWALSPAYDLTFPRAVRKGWNAPQAMAINGKVENIGLDDVMAVAKHNGIKRAKAILERVELAVQQWPTLAERYKLNQPAATIIPTYFKRLLS